MKFFENLRLGYSPFRNKHREMPKARTPTYLLSVVTWFLYASLLTVATQRSLTKAVVVKMTQEIGKEQLFTSRNLRARELGWLKRNR